MLTELSTGRYTLMTAGQTFINISVFLKFFVAGALPRL